MDVLERESRYIRKHGLQLEGQRFGCLEVIERIGTNKQGRVLWKCLCDCGNYAEVVSSRLTLGRTRSCGCNKKSKHEKWTEEILIKHNIDYISEYRFKDCKNHFQLPFDFYLPKYNICIECQGQQHYRMVDYFGGEEAFQRRKENDKIKKKYCENHNIFLLELNYKLNKTKIENEILNILNPVTITV